MTALVVAETLKTVNGSSSTQTLTTSSGTAAGDTLAVLYASDFYTFASMPNPTSSAGTLTPSGSVDIGDTFGHIKAFTCPITTGGSKTITIPAHTDCDIFGIVLRITGTATVDGTPASQFDTTNTVASHVAPSVTTTIADALMVCCWLKTNAGSGWTGEQYTVQPSMTKRAEAASSPFAALCVATETSPTPGATGSRTATWLEPKVYGAVTFALAGAGAPPATAPPPARRRVGALLQL